ncbi:hypothetical protein Dimus_038092 [Dionaea muscipula]
MPLRSGTDHQATSSNTPARHGRPPRPPGVVIQETPQGDAPDPIVDSEDGTATVRLTPDEYARFQEVQNLSAEEWQRFQEYLRFTQMHAPPAASAPVAPPPAVPVPPAVAQRPAAVVLPPEEIQGRSFDRFVGAHPPKFVGTPDAIEASNYLMEVEEILRRIGCLLEHRVSHATFMLKDTARSWWRGVQRQFDARGEDPTWEDFVTEFELKFFTAHFRAQKKTELLALKQGTMRIPEYEAKFFELGRFAPELLETEEDKMFLFERGMDPELFVHVRSHDCTSLTRMIQHAARLEDAMIAARGTGQKRAHEEPVQSQSHQQSSQSQSHKKKFHNGNNKSSGSSGSFRSFSSGCKKCGKSHSRGYTCDGRPIICHSCGKPGHVATLCRSSGR